MIVPDDFPREHGVAGLAGARSMVLVPCDAKTGGQERYEICVELMDQLVAQCRKNRYARYAALSELEILERLFAQLLGTGWGSDAEMAWVIVRAAAELNWTVPMGNLLQKSPAAISLVS
ncbi:hypothetical protein [Rugamonas sp.]|uniref:hypothetical protein n=1 Tax=Rugamonas sp. TaxID=1926287 RepID=UPI0025FB477B|nr:hypothetical protein [Rugamonas sp.]